MKIIFTNIHNGIAIRVKDEKIERIGEESSTFVSSGDKIVDCGGSFIYEAFSDKHAHLSILSLEYSTLNLTEVKSLDDLAKKIKKYRGDVVVGRGWDESMWNGEMPDRKFLDSVEPDKPIFLIRVDGHMAVMNTKAWEIYKPNGDFSRGFVYEEEVGKIMKKIPLDKRKGLKSAIEHAIKEGVVEIHEMGGGIDWYKEILDIQPKIEVKFYLHRDWDRINEIPRKHGNVELLGIKIFADGSIGAKNAAVSTGYTDGSFQQPFLNKRDIENLAKYAENVGLQLSVHAIGDLAIREAVEGLKNRKRKHRIEHFELVPDEYADNPKILENIEICMQPNFLKWAYPNGLYERNIGREWAIKCNPFSKLYENINLKFGSDSMPLSPAFGLKILQNPPYPQQGLPLNKAMKIYRRNPLEEGYEATFTLRNKPLPDGEIIMTVLKGKIIFKKETYMY